MHNFLTILRKIISEITPDKPFENSAAYWENRYRTGGRSGSGSFKELAEYKAEIINGFVKKNIQSVIEYGCGDGNQLGYGRYKSYIGFDVSPEAISICKKKFKNDKSKSFKKNSDYAGELADLALSMDVIYHLVEDDVFHSYMKRLFDSSNKHVLIYSSDFETHRDTMDHVRHRNFTRFIEESFPEWKLSTKIDNKFPFKGDVSSGSHSDFFIYKKIL